MRTQHNLAAVALFSALLASAMPAQASPVYFSFADVNGVDLSFTIDTEAAPDSFFPGISTSFDGIEALSGGSSFTIFPVFYSLDVSGGLNAFGFNLTGPQLYATGTESAPVFLTGSHQLMGSFGDTTLTISAPPPTTVPEPSSVPLIALALAGMAAARNRTRI